MLYINLKLLIEKGMFIYDLHTHLQKKIFIFFDQKIKISLKSSDVLHHDVAVRKTA